MSFGIDFGTFWSSAAVMVGGELRLVKEPIGQGYSLPSAVYWDAPEGLLLIGEQAELARGNDPTCYCREFKRAVGRNESHLLGGRTFITEELIAAVLGGLADLATPLCPGGRPSEAVVAVPATYSGHRRGCIERAATRAGLTARLIEEPVAAAMYHEHRRLQLIPNGEPVLVYDLGGGTFDAVLMARKGGTFQRLAPPLGLDDQGGTDFDRAIFQDLCRRCRPELKAALDDLSDPDALRMRYEVWDICRSVKHHLSGARLARVRITQVRPSEEYRLDVAGFESLIRPLIDATISQCRQMLATSGLKADNPPRILLTGGSTRIPLVARVLEEEFGRKPDPIDDPELAVCQGAALFGVPPPSAVSLQGRIYRLNSDPFRPGP